MALTTATYSSFFKYSEATKQITFTDSTDFVGQGTVAANVTVVAKVVGPSGTFYNNTNHGAPDIDCGVSLDSIITIPLPLDGSGLPEQGTYTMTLTYQDLVVPATVVEVRSFELNYSSPTVDIGMTVDCVTPLLTATDNSNYTVNSVEPSIVRAFAIHYPPSTPTADVTGTAASINTSVFYTVADSTVEHSSSLTSTLTYLVDPADLIYVIDSVTGSKVVQVACNGDICDIYCCIRSQWNKYQSYVANNNTIEAAREYGIFEQIVALASLVGMAVKCSKDAHISGYVEKILELANCDAGCSCNDGEPQLVTGLAINGNTVVVESGTGTNVTSATGGGITTYTVNLNTANINKLAATYNTVVAAGTNVDSVSVATATVADVTTKTYTVNASTQVSEAVYARVLFTMQSAAVPTITIPTQKEYGTTFQALTQVNPNEFIENLKDTNFAEWTTNNTQFTVGNFFASPSAYWPQVELVNIVTTTKGDEFTWTNNLDVEITTMGANSFNMRFIDENGRPVNGQSIQDNYVSFELIFKINA